MTPSLSNNYLPLSEFLTFFQISLKDYFSLTQVPFPVVRRLGRVIYLRNDSYRMYDMCLNNPADTDTTSISESDILAECHIDFSILKEPSKDSLENFFFRLGYSPLDTSRTSIRDARISTQTKDSSTDISCDTSTGINRISLSMVTTSYPFTSLDICNNVSPMLEQIKSGNFVGSIENGRLIIKPIRTTLFGNKSMSNSSVSGIIDQNKAALITATKLEVGHLALDLLTEQVLKTLPAPLQLMITSNPLIKIAVANLINIIIQQTGLQDPKIQAVNEAMLTVSWMETIKTFDFKAILDGVLSNIPANKIDTLVAAKAESQ